MSIRNSAVTVRFSFADTPFGMALIASTDTGICALSFDEDHGAAVDALRVRYPDATLAYGSETLQRKALASFVRPGSVSEVPLDLVGTPFQRSVWRALLRVPFGLTTTYGQLASRIGRPGAARAVGTAVGANPVAFFVPCHRVLPANGGIGGFRWGPARKGEILEWEKEKTARARGRQ